MGKAKTQRVIANVMALALAVSAIPFASKVEVNAQPDTEEDNLTYQGASVYSTSGNLKEKAVIQGENAEVYEDETQGKVLKLSGNSPQAGVLKLPENLYKNVTDGFTLTMDVSVSESAVDYTRLFQSSYCEMGSKGAPWNSPGVSIDLGGGNQWRTEVFVGKDSNAAAELENRTVGDKGISRETWHSVTFSVDSTKAVLTVDNESYIISEGDFSKLFGSEKYLDSYVYNAIGDSIYGDSSVQASIDNVKFYNSADTLDDTTLQVYYDFEDVEKVPAQTTTGDAGTYTDGTVLIQVGEAVSPDGNTVVSIKTDDAGRYFYSVRQNGEDIIYASRLGLKTGDADFTSGVSYQQGTIAEVTDDYQLYQGKHQGEIKDTCTEDMFTLTKDGKELTVVIRVYDDGVAYRYESKEGASVSQEASEFVFPDQAAFLSYEQPNYTYEGTYKEYSMNQVYQAAGSYTVPSLVTVNNHYVLLTEAAVFSEEESYCSSYLKTAAGSKNLTWVSGNKQAGNVVMNQAFQTPWRVAVIGEDLNTVVNSDIVTSVNPDAGDRDWSFVKPGKTAWSWWSSTGDDPIAYELQKDYIDFAAANGWEYVCLDYGWILWDDYKEKVKELADYAKEKGVGLWLWYGVNDVSHTAAGAYPDHSLLNKENITSEFEWASSIGIKGVKVDYYESDNQAAMNQMYLCADIAADNELMVLFHGCTNPGGENRTFPNVISYEAVYGAEYYKWRSEPSTANIINYLFTRNAVGSADFTPTALPVANIDATYGFMLAVSAYLESGIVHFAENVNVYEGFSGLSFMNELPSSWDETVVLEGKPGSYGTVARRAGENWFVAGLSTQKRETEIPLDFLADGKTYDAVIYRTAEDNSGLDIEREKVTKEDVLTFALAKDDGVAVMISEDAGDLTTSYEKNYAYYEAERADISGKAVVADNQYASGQQVAGYIGKGTENAVNFDVDVEEAGVYELKTFYVSGTDRRYEISVNGNEAVRTKNLNSGDWVSVAQDSIYVSLQAGTNTITYTNSENDAPNLDRIAVSRAKTDKEPTASDDSKDETGTEEGSSYTYTIYEAEDAVIKNAQKNTSTVGWLGGSEDSYVLFGHVTAEEDGTYYLMVRYFSGEDRQVYVSVNGEEPQVIDCKSSGAWSEYASQAYAKVTLHKGENTIKVYNPKAYCPDLDAIGISTTKVDTGDNEQPGDNPDNSGDDKKSEDNTGDNKQSEDNPDNSGDNKQPENGTGVTENPESTDKNQSTAAGQTETKDKTKSGDADIPKTGDRSDIMVWSTLLGVSFAGFAGVIYKKKKERI